MAHHQRRAQIAHMVISSVDGHEYLHDPRYHADAKRLIETLTEVDMALETVSEMDTSERDRVLEVALRKIFDPRPAEMIKRMVGRRLFVSPI